MAAYRCEVRTHHGESSTSCGGLGGGDGCGRGADGLGDSSERLGGKGVRDVGLVVVGARGVAGREVESSEGVVVG